MTNKRNAKKILDEFYEYHKEINPEFVKLAINYIYRIALKVRTEAPHALVIYQKILENLHEGSEHCNYIAIGTAVIIRAFPKVKGGTDIVKAIGKVYKSLQDQEAKVAFIWLLGEYCEKIDGSGPILEYFSNNFFSQTSAVQLQVLNSGIKMYLNEISPIDEVLQTLLQQISDKSTSPDLRDRGYIYWRLLFQNPEKASEVVFNDIPPILVEEEEDDLELAEKLIRNGGSVSSHLGKMLSSVFTKKVSAINRGEVEMDSEFITDAQKDPVTNLPDVNIEDDHDDEDILGSNVSAPPKQTTSVPVIGIDDFDILGGSSGSGIQGSSVNIDDGMDILGMGFSSAPEKKVAQSNFEEDLFGDAEGFVQARKGFINMPSEILLKDDTQGKSGNKGILVKGGFKRTERTSGVIQLELEVVNKTTSALNDFVIQMRPSQFGLKVQGFNNDAIGKVLEYPFSSVQLQDRLNRSWLKLALELLEIHKILLFILTEYTRLSSVIWTPSFSEFHFTHICFL